MTRIELPYAVNPAVSLPLHAWNHWRGVTDPERSALIAHDEM